MGRSFAARVAASLLNIVGLPELITTSQEACEVKAIALAGNPDRLRGIKAKLETNGAASPLFDSVLSTRHNVTAYEAMYARCQAGLPPEAIEIQP